MKVAIGLEAAFYIMWLWHQGKIFFEHSVSFSQDALHVVAGVLVLLAAGLLLRKPISSWWSWLTVLVFTHINEFIDLSVEKWPVPAMQYGEGFKDVLLTMFLPTVLMIYARLLPSLYRRAHSSAELEDNESQSGE